MLMLRPLLPPRFFGSLILHTLLQAMELIGEEKKREEEMRERQRRGDEAR